MSLRETSEKRNFAEVPKLPFFSAFPLGSPSELPQKLASNVIRPRMFRNSAGSAEVSKVCVDTGCQKCGWLCKSIPRFLRFKMNQHESAILEIRIAGAMCIDCHVTSP
ncbi:hypothetical protein Y032_0178g690 [Ancylostoma ceylanicum]|uniref:Uncharacterized protein n=1 Tax=Ancylostoma ceylanicum TaxID=53326 RepID=A0A016ST28_9BILA|nr:hypothetical protein Y032_0178g690 [Ancylostoma ceylanicum]